VNDKLPEAEKFDHLGWYFSKRPDSIANTECSIQTAAFNEGKDTYVLMFAFLVVAAWSFRFLKMTLESADGVSGPKASFR